MINFNSVSSPRLVDTDVVGEVVDRGGFSVAGREFSISVATDHGQVRPQESAAGRFFEGARRLCATGSCASQTRALNAVLFPKPAEVLGKSQAALNRLGEYACTDARTFVRPSHPRYAQIMSRLGDFGQDANRMRANQQANMSANVAAGFEVDRSKLDRIARLVDEAQAGCCSTLAYAGAAELLKHAGACRVEVVAHHQGHNTTHCFIIVGRAHPSDLAQVGSWGADAIVVDPWAATIGGQLSGPPSHPPISNLWPPTQSLFDSRGHA
ncbi:hypothetical protein [Chromobacterium piscinae]|uniref:Uncharacterized protein n=1 Tax=Chromobacterium piscinae TaxID=686831 RepID=A0ABV0H9I3_9NEIS|nr:hypothetical protein [Chromobacterium piscinae]MBX9298409.1 hypothetical protein [Chromobacterium vaccinii]MBX9358295.1 hypothetical protein [Chromobacterium vaccinii]MCD5328486.1 hypothetical protein [Chromobacterium piscinae]NHQ82748.1 hypothetical protein [Chromobacterium vaccinii]